MEDIYNKLIFIKEEGDMEYVCIVIDDFANKLKDNDVTKHLREMVMKARYISCSFLYFIQYYYLPKVL